MNKIYVVMEADEYEVLWTNAFTTLEKAEEFIVDSCDFDKATLDDLEHFGHYNVGNGFTMYFEEVPVDKFQRHITGDGIIKREPASESRKWKKL